MEVILLERIHNLGKLGDKVRVKPGYGRNYLVPRKKAVPATADNVARFEAQRAELEKAQAEGLARATLRADAMRELELTIVAKAGSEGRLYGSVGAGEICDALAAAGREVDRREVRLANGPLRSHGRHVVEIALHADIHVPVAIVITGQEGGQAAEG
ncbi:MAG: 50S ribosomal protein L9 [Gammaproteobacteria bacterium]|nr:50S ribosomal protein L9 [Gammaproteobacteria bacterium]